MAKANFAGDVIYAQDLNLGYTAPSNLAAATGTGFGNVSFSGFLNESATVAITAGTTRTQAGATALTTEINRVDTSTAPSAGTVLGDGVMLPATGAFARDILVINNTANPIQVYGAGTDTINGVAATTGVTQSQNSVGMYVSASSGTWASIDIAMGYSGNYQTTSAVSGLNANSTLQAGAIALPAMINRVTTVGSAGNSAILPVSAPGLVIMVVNAAASNSMNVYPQVGDTMNGTANAAFAVAAGKTAQFYCANTGAWHSLLSA